MTVAMTERPTAAEHIPYYEQYIRLAPDGDILATLARQIETTTAFFARLTPEQATWRPAPGEWCATDIVGHLADAERLFANRAWRLARGDMQLPEPMEPDDYAAVADYARRPLGEVLDELAAQRAATLALLRGLDAVAWARRAPESWSCRSVRGFAYILAGHEIHHLNDVRDRL